MTLAQREEIAIARARGDTIRAGVAAGGPWPLADRWDDAPETEWGPPETLAHVAEMLGYWDGETLDE